MASMMQQRMQSGRVASAQRALPVASPVVLGLAAARHAPLLPERASFVVQPPTRTHRKRLCLAQADVKEAESATSNEASSGPEWVPVCLPEELPKGTRKEIEVNGLQVLLFWYRNQIYCIEARSPAEGAYSEGFIKAKFTQDYCIECPSTGSLFSLKDGSIVSWYPNNPVLATLTPRDLCRPMEIYPVKLAQEALYVDVSGAQNARSGTDRGGARSSLEQNNVFSSQPNVYFEGMDPAKEQASIYMDQVVKPKEALNPAVAIATTAGIGAFAVAGTAVCIYLENLALLGVFWAILGGTAAFIAYRYVQSRSEVVTK